MPYKTVHIGGQGEIEEKKSRFIATVHPIASEDEALRFLSDMRKKYWDARHNCYAYTTGINFELQRCSDDGEPGGTAGRPILSVILKEEIHNCIIVVTRYFGGTLLGTGGLVRAYQAATQAGLAKSVIIERQTGQKLTLHTDYTSVGKLQHLIACEKAGILDNRYTDTVEIDVIVPAGETAQFSEKVNEATNGKCRIRTGDMTEFAFLDEDIVIL